MVMMIHHFTFHLKPSCATREDRQVEHAGAHAELSPQRATSAQPRHWERHAWQSWEAGRLGAEKAQSPELTQI